MAETRKTKELNLLEDKPELLDKKTSPKEPPVPDHEVYNKQNSDSKKDQNKFMKSWHNNKKFRIGIIVGIVCVFGLSLGLGLGLGLKKDDDEPPFGPEFEHWVEVMNNTPENDIRDLENAAIIWALDTEVSLNFINSGDATAAKNKATKKAERQISDEKKEQKKNDEDWDNYLVGEGFDNEEEYYNSKVANDLITSSNVIDGLTDFDDTTNKIDNKSAASGYEFVSSAPGNAGNDLGEYLAVTSNLRYGIDDAIYNPTETLMELYLNIAKPVYFQQESISYTLNSSANPGSNPNEWNSMTFSDNNQVQAAYAMAWKLDNASTKGFYDLGKGDTPIISPTASGIKHFNSLPTDLTTLAYYYATVGNETNIEVITPTKDVGLGGLGEKADQVVIKNSNATDDTGIDEETWSETSITEANRIAIANTVFNGKTASEPSATNIDGSSWSGLSSDPLYSNGSESEGDRILGKTIELDSQEEGSDEANIKNEYLLTTDSAGFTITRIEDPNYIRVDQNGELPDDGSVIESDYDLYKVGERMLESDLEKELNTEEKSYYEGINKYGIWDDFELWVNTNAKVLALNWALTAEGSDFLTNDDYHIEIMDKLTKTNKNNNEIEITRKGESLLYYYYSELVINQEQLFLDKYYAIRKFMIKDENNEIYKPLNLTDEEHEDLDFNNTFDALYKEFDFFGININYNENSKQFELTSFDELLSFDELPGISGSGVQS